MYDIIIIFKIRIHDKIFKNKKTHTLRIQILKPHII